MKKVYLLVLSAILGTGLMAQQAISVVQSDKSNSKTEVKATNTVSGNAKIQPGSIQTELPGFPLYVDTGNKELDNANYKAAKEVWINENRALYDAYLNQTSITSDPENLRSMPGYPQYIDTGNPLEDKAQFDQAREKWFYDYKMSLRTKN